MDETPNSCPTCGACWRLPAILALVLTAILLSQYWRGKRADKLSDGQPAAAEAEHKPIALEIDFGGGRKKAFAVPWHRGLTVADSLAIAKEIVVEKRGAGQGAFLTSIDGVTNEGTEGNNWTFAVNGKPADRSFAVYELQPGDRVLWSFGPKR